MKAGSPRIVTDLYDWLPSYGENAIVLHAKGGDLSLVVEFDGSDGNEKKREIFFKGTAAFMRAAVPGVQLLDISYPEKEPLALSALVEYQESEAALAWTRHFGDGRIIKHFSAAFLSENTLVEIFAGECVLGEVVNLVR